MRREWSEATMGPSSVTVCSHRSSTSLVFMCVTECGTPSISRSRGKVQPDTSDVDKEESPVPRLEGRPGHASVLLLHPSTLWVRSVADDGYVRLGDKGPYC